ncbi:MAG: flagellar hook-associated protein FlgL [Vulcanibacillus sp.]
MRISQSMLSNNALHNLNNNLRTIQKLNEQLATGKKINKLSDDPVGLSFSLRYKEDLAQNKQFQRNVDYANSKIIQTENSISATNDILQRARELAVQGANGSSSKESRSSIASEIHQLYEQLVDIGNSQYNGEYIFNGQLTNIKPYDSITAPLTTPDQGKIQLEVGKGITFGINVSGATLFGEAGDPTNAFSVLKQLETALLNDNAEEISNSFGVIDERLNVVIERFADVGAITNRIELITARLKEEDINLNSLISQTEDADIAMVITSLNSAQNIYEASLKVTADIIQPSLLNFLK